MKRYRQNTRAANRTGVAITEPINGARLLARRVMKIDVDRGNSPVYFGVWLQLPDDTSLVILQNLAEGQ